MKKVSIALVLIFISFYFSYSQVLNPVKWKFSSEIVRQNVYELRFSATIDKGWHMYGLNVPENGPIPTSFLFSPSSDVKYLNEITPEKNPEIEYDSTFEMDVELFSEQIAFTRQVEIPPEKQIILEGSVEFMACDDSRCLPPKEVEFVFTFDENSVKKQTESIKTSDEKIAPGTVSSTFETRTIGITSDSASMQDSISGFSADTVSSDIPEENDEGNSKMNDRSLIGLFLLALIAGFGALLTPCVYPIIPLTVSFFMRDVSRSKAIANGLLFGISIVVIYTLVGLLVGILKIDLVRLVSSHWLPNIIFFLIFLALAFSFFGMFEITLPGSLSNKIDQQADKGGFLGPFFMALATVIISFSCTGPIVGVVLGSALQGEIIKPVVGMLGFSISFALPFTLMAIFPGFLKKLPKSGGWLNSVKVFFAFILLAFSLVFISNLRLSFITREVILSVSVAIFYLLGLYLMGKIKFPHDTSVESISVLRLLLTIASFGFSIYLFTGLFGAPLKSISPFLPPPDSQSAFYSNRQAIPSSENKLSEFSVNVCDSTPKYSDILDLPLGLKGYFDYEEALMCAQQVNKPVLLDFAGHSCKNCKKMYAEVWSDPRVLNKLKNDFIIAVLYTDDRTKLPENEWVTSSIDGKVKNTMGKKFNDLQITKFRSNALPLYAIVDAQGNVLTSKEYYTYSPDVEGFLEFLNEGLKHSDN